MNTNRRQPGPDDAEKSAQNTVRAAGVLLFTRNADARPEYLLLESARHGTWGFPKGHCEAGESTLETARREVAEETGDLAWDAIPGFHAESRYQLPAPQHADGQASPSTQLKEVQYFLGKARSRELHISEEHRSARWSKLAEALSLLQHEENRRILRAADEFLRSHTDESP